MREALLGVALAASLLGAPGVLANHTDSAPTRCDGGFCADGEHHVLDCARGHCTGDARGFATIVNPAYGDGALLADDDVVLGFSWKGAERAYPVEILNYFETVSETIAGDPVLVTYCPLCGSGIVWSRVVDREALTFLNTGAIWKNDLVMYDRETGSWWTQVGGEAIRGAHHGKELALLPSALVEWREWREAHPDTLVLARPVDAQGRELAPYDRDFTDSYRADPSTPQARLVRDESGIHPKERVVGVEIEAESFAFPLSVMRKTRVRHVTLGGTDLVAGFAGEGVHVYHADGRSFTPEGNETMADENGTRYRIVSGFAPETRESLRPVPAQSLYWFAWLEFHPQTGVLNATGVVVEPGKPLEGAGKGRETPTVGVAPAIGVAAAWALAMRGRRAPAERVGVARKGHGAGKPRP